MRLIKPTIIGNAILYQADCLDVLPSLNVDAIVTDPPYGLGYQHGGKGGGGAPRLARVLRYNEPIIGDDKPFDPAHLLNTRDAILWGANHYANKLPPSPGWLVWDKLEWSTPDSFSDCELAWHKQGTKTRKLPLMWKGIRVAAAARAECTAGAKRFHPAQKPVALMMWCLSFVRGIVCDPYMGSGSTGVACISLGMRFIGIEIKQQYFDIACERIERAAAQGQLALSPPDPGPREK